MKIRFTWMGANDHEDADMVGGSFVWSYCCQPSDDYCLDFTSPEDWALFRDGKPVNACVLLTDLCQAIMFDEDCDPEKLAGRGLAKCECCGAFFPLGEWRQGCGGHMLRVCQPLKPLEERVRDMEAWYAGEPLRRTLEALGEVTL